VGSCAPASNLQQQTIPSQPNPHTQSDPNPTASQYVRESLPEGVQEVEYEVLNILEFNSTRKRMSVVLRCPDNRILLYCKVRGAGGAGWSAGWVVGACGWSSLSLTRSYDSERPRLSPLQQPPTHQSSAGPHPTRTPQIPAPPPGRRHCDLRAPRSRPPHQRAAARRDAAAHGGLRQRGAADAVPVVQGDGRGQLRRVSGLAGGVGGWWWCLVAGAVGVNG